MFTERQSCLFSNGYQLPGLAVSTKKTNVEFEKIIAEYSLKQNNFNPKNPSPNLFINKLKKRFDYYYSSQTVN
jgi:hypothetical protein